MTAATNERAAALAALTFGVTVDGRGGEQPAPRLERTGRTLECGGDLPRLLLSPAPTLGWFITGVGYQRCGAVPGDVVLIDQGQATRLDGLGVTIDPDAYDDVEEDVVDVDLDGLPSDEELAKMGAADAIAYVQQHPDQAARVRELELAKRETKRRSSVLDATNPDILEAARIEADEAAKATAQDPGDVHGPTATEVAVVQQSNDAPGAGE